MSEALSVLMPGIDDAQRIQRERIESVRNIAAAKITTLTGGPAATLCWLITDLATEWLFRAATIEQITEVAEQCRRLLIVADTAERLEEYLDA